MVCRSRWDRGITDLAPSGLGQGIRDRACDRNALRRQSLRDRLQGDQHQVIYRGRDALQACRAKAPRPFRPHSLPRGLCFQVDWPGAQHTGQGGSCTTSQRSGKGTEARFLRIRGSRGRQGQVKHRPRSSWPSRMIDGSRASRSFRSTAKDMRPNFRPSFSPCRVRRSANPRSLSRFGVRRAPRRERRGGGQQPPGSGEGFRFRRQWASTRARPRVCAT